MVKIAVVYDRDGWCWYYQSIALKKYAPSGFDVTVMDGGQFSHVRGGFDAVLYFSLAECAQVEWARLISVAAHHGLTLPEGCVGTTKNRNAVNAARKASHVDGLICVNKHLSEFFADHAEVAYLPAGVDTEVFHPPPYMISLSDVPLRVGWCGQKLADNKGIWEVLQLQSELPGLVQWCINDRTADNALPQEVVADWYRSLDVFLCTSVHEGTPMPPLEAAACGCHVLTTRVGDMAEMNTFQFLHDPVPEIAEALQHFDSNRDELWTRRMCCQHEVWCRRNWESLAGDWLRFVAFGQQSHKEQ